MIARNGLSSSLLDNLIFIGWLQKRFRLPLLSWAVVIFSLYYLLPLLLGAIEGVLVSAPAGNIEAGTPFGILTQAIGRRNVHSPYLKDLTHLLMAAVVSVGGALGICALSELIRVYNAVSDPNLIQTNATTIASERARMESLARNRAVLVPIALVAGSCGLALYFNGRADTGWWGNPRYGPAGIMLAFGVSVVIFYGMHALYMLAVAQYSIGRLVSNGVHLRPFHPDGCNGFGKLGNLLLLLLLMCVFCAAAAWIAIWHGYLGIQDFPGIWLAALGIVIFLPIIVIYPLVHVSTEVRKAQLLRLAPIEQVLNSQLRGIEDGLGERDAVGAKLENMKGVQDSHLLAKGIYETSVFPFNRKVASVLSVGYILQAAALAGEIIGKFK